jgi:uncharacterized protein (DUF2062 family)
LNYSRQIRYFYLRFIRLRGEPHELALGGAFGIFAGMMPIMPFQIALAVALALFFKGSKITAALGTWISNPLNWYFLYRFSYRIGASILGISQPDSSFKSIMASIQHAEGTMAMVGKIAGAGSTIIASFLLGGFLLGAVFALPSYFIFLRMFRVIKDWRETRREARREARSDRRHWQRQKP